MNNLLVEPAQDFVRYGAKNCVVVPDGAHPTYEEVWELAKKNQATILDDGQDDASDGDLVVARFGDGQQREYTDAQLIARLRSDFGEE